MNVQSNRQSARISRHPSSTRAPTKDSGGGQEVKGGLQYPRTITITTDEPAVLDRAIEALAAEPEVFKRGNALVWVVRDDRQLNGVARPPDTPRIVALPLPTLREKLAGVAKWIKVRERDNAATLSLHPPVWAVKAVAARGNYPGIRSIEGVVETPIMRPDGSILAAPGYDAETGLLFEPRVDFPVVPENPTVHHAKQAAADLIEVVENFPFALSSHRSGWLASVLTPFARFGFHGPVPMFSVDANTRGTGKTLLHDVTGVIVAGVAMPKMVNPEDDTEMRKRITALAMEGERMALIDNVGNVLGCPSLDAALTATTWKDRILGVTKSTTALPMNVTFYASGNNIVYNGDTVRRVVPIRLESAMEKPEQRSGFRHPNLLGWVRQERPRLVTAALTILRAFCAAGRPNQGLVPWGSYEEWSALVRQAIVFSGLDDPADAREELDEHSDHEAGSLRALIAGWQEIAGDGGMTVAEVFRRLDANVAANHINASCDGHEALKWMTLRSAIAEISGKALGTLPSPRSFGMRMGHQRGRVIGGKRLLSQQDRSGAMLWRVSTN